MTRLLRYWSLNNRDLNLLRYLDDPGFAEMVLNDLHGMPAERVQGGMVDAQDRVLKFVIVFKVPNNDPSFARILPIDPERVRAMLLERSEVSSDLGSPSAQRSVDHETCIS
ncbi:MAG TPA: hypothetical protein VFB42_03390 [Gaiellaceae bacterium]|nr:hypothetical protein [Gaiellaceae bacterium]